MVWWGVKLFLSGGPIELFLFLANVPHLVNKGRGMYCRVCMGGAKIPCS